MAMNGLNWNNRRSGSFRMPMKIEWHLPEGVVVEVLKLLPVFDVGRAACTSHIWADAANADEVRKKVVEDICPVLQLQ